MDFARITKPATIALLAGLTLLVSACMLVPGRFVSDLDVRDDGLFTFRYSGQIVMLPLSDMADKANKQEFEPQPCEADNGVPRDCSKGEIEEQRKEWEESQNAKSQGEAEMMGAMLGGIDPSDPKEAEALAEQLRRQAGWRSVEYKGNGIYDVDFAISGRIDHDFTFPTIEGFPMANPFVQISRRKDGSIRIDAPAFGPAGGSPMGGLMQAAAMSESKGKKEIELPEPEGTFTIRTNATILANNTDEGPQALAGGDQSLKWDVNARTAAAPTALVKLAP
jgi:hypothetical protein